MVHRAIKSQLNGKAPSIKNIEATVLHCSTTERTADEATRDVESWLKCYFMQDKVGQSFWATVAGVTGFGLFMELDDIYIEGLLHVTELGNDYFTFDKARHAMVGEKTNLTYRLGDRIEVKVIRVDLDSIKIDLALVGSLKKPSKKSKKSFIRSEKINKKNKRRNKK